MLDDKDRTLTIPADMNDAKNNILSLFPRLFVCTIAVSLC